MPRARRRCPRKGCRLWQPCSAHPPGWNKDRPGYRELPSNWNAIKKKVRERDGDVCVDCGSMWETQVDHVIERADGGPDLLWNLVIRCKLCHQKKTREAQKKRRKA